MEPRPTPGSTGPALRAGRLAGRLRFLAGENLSTPVLARASIVLVCSAFALILVTGLARSERDPAADR